MTPSPGRARYCQWFGHAWTKISDAWTKISDDNQPRTCQRCGTPYIEDKK